VLARQLHQAQIDNHMSEVAQRKAAGERQAQVQKLLGDAFGPSQPAPAAPGQLGSGSFGIAPPPTGQASIPQGIPQSTSRIGSMSPDSLALLKANGLDLVDVAKLARPDMQVSNGYAYDKNSTLPGFLPQLNVANNGQVTQVQIERDGQPVVAAPRGSLEAYTAFRNADEAAKAGSDLVKKWDPVQKREVYVSRASLLEQPATPPPSNAPTQPRSPLTMPGDADRDLILQTEYATAKQRLAQAQNDPRSTPDTIRRSQQDVTDLEKQLRITPSAMAPAASAPAAAGPSTTEINAAAAGKEYDTQVAKDVAEQRKSIMAAGSTAPLNIARYQQIGKLLQDVDGGALTPTGTHIASLANSFGLKIDKNLPNKEAASAMANQAALELRSPAGGAGMPGAMSDADRNFLVSMTPNMAQTAQGRKQIIDSYIAVQQRNQQVAQFARNYEKKYGRLDNAFFDQLQAWSSANPMFGGK
jgi:hypothetical protein